MLCIASHCFLTHDEKLKAWDDVPDSCHTLTQEGLLDVGWLPQCVLVLLELLPFSPTKVVVCVATMVQEAWYNAAQVHKESELSYGLLRHVLAA